MIENFQNCKPRTILKSYEVFLLFRNENEMWLIKERNKLTNFVILLFYQKCIYCLKLLVFMIWQPIYPLGLSKGADGERVTVQIKFLKMWEAIVPICCMRPYNRKNQNSHCGLVRQNHLSEIIFILILTLCVNKSTSLLAARFPFVKVVLSSLFFFTAFLLFGMVFLPCISSSKPNCPLYWFLLSAPFTTFYLL